MEPTSELRIPTSRIKMLKLWSLPAGVIAALAVWDFYRQGQLSTWSLLLVIGVLALVLQGQLTAHRGYLHLTPHGVTTHFPFRKRTYAWSEIDPKGFRPLIELKVFREMIVFNHAQGSSPYPGARKSDQQGKDYDDYFGNLFAADTDELAALLNQWHQRYARGTESGE